MRESSRDRNTHRPYASRTSLSAALARSIFKESEVDFGNVDDSAKQISVGGNDVDDDDDDDDDAPLEIQRGVKNSSTELPQIRVARMRRKPHKVSSNLR